MNSIIVLLALVISKALRFWGSIFYTIHNWAHNIRHIASVTGFEKLLLLVFGSSISYFQWSISVKGLKMLWWLIKWLRIGSISYINTLCGQPISILYSTKTLLLECLCKYETAIFDVSNFKALLTYHFLTVSYRHQLCC